MLITRFRPVKCRVPHCPTQHSPWLNFSSHCPRLKLGREHKHPEGCQGHYLLDCLRKPPRIPISNPIDSTLIVTPFRGQCSLGELMPPYISNHICFHKNPSSWPRGSTRQTAITYKPYRCPQESSTTHQPRSLQHVYFQAPHYGFISHSQREFFTKMQINMATAWLATYKGTLFPSCWRHYGIPRRQSHRFGFLQILLFPNRNCNHVWNLPATSRKYVSKATWSDLQVSLTRSDAPSAFRPGASWGFSYTHPKSESLFALASIYLLFTLFNLFILSFVILAFSESVPAMCW